MVYWLIINFNNYLYFIHKFLYFKNSLGIFGDWGNKLELLKEGNEIFLVLIFIELTGINSSSDGLLFSSDSEGIKSKESFWLKKLISSTSSEDLEEKFEGKGDFNLIYWFDIKIGRTSILISGLIISEVILL